MSNLYNRNAFIISLLYLTVGLVYIYFSDYYLARDIEVLTLTNFTKYQTIKGFIFIIVTAFLLYILITLFSNKLKNTAAEYKLLFDMNPAPAFIYHKTNYNFLKVNKAAEIYYGYTNKEFLSMNIMDIRPKEDVEELKKFIQGKGNKSLFHGGTWRHMKKNGEVFFANIEGSQFMYEGHEARMIIVFDSDKLIKQDKEIKALNTELESRLIEKNQLISRLNKYLDNLEEFNYAMSHNFRSHVANILGLLELFKFTEINNSNVEEIIEKLNFSVNELDKILHNLTFLLTSKNSVENINEEFNVRQLISHELTQANNNFIIPEEFNIDLDVSMELTIVGVKSHYKYIFGELIKNACKFKSPNRALFLKINVIKNEAFTLITIEDNGLGVDSKLIESKLFKLFSRFHPSVQGTGFGLYMIHSLVEIMNGSIQAESNLDEGMKITITIPLPKIHT
jgi:PAS domain S-box-containing protein